MPVGSLLLATSTINKHCCTYHLKSSRHGAKQFTWSFSVVTQQCFYLDSLGQISHPKGQNPQIIPPLTKIFISQTGLIVFLNQMLLRVSIYGFFLFKKLHQPKYLSTFFLKIPHFVEKHHSGSGSTVKPTFSTNICNQLNVYP